jgi:hypothetical protein
LRVGERHQREQPAVDAAERRRGRHRHDGQRRDARRRRDPHLTTDLDPEAAGEGVAEGDAPAVCRKLRLVGRLHHVGDEVGDFSGAGEDVRPGLVRAARDGGAQKQERGGRRDAGIGRQLASQPVG